MEPRSTRPEGTLKTKTGPRLPCGNNKNKGEHTQFDFNFTVRNKKQSLRNKGLPYHHKGSFNFTFHLTGKKGLLFEPKLGFIQLISTISLKQTH